MEILGDLAKIWEVNEMTIVNWETGKTSIPQKIKEIIEEEKEMYLSAWKKIKLYRGPVYPSILESLVNWLCGIRKNYVKAFLSDLPKLGPF